MNLTKKIKKILRLLKINIKNIYDLYNYVKIIKQNPGKIGETLGYAKSGKTRNMCK